MATYELTLGSGSYSWTGESLGLLASRKLSLEPGAYSLTGSDVGLLFNRKLSLGAGSYLWTGAAMSFGFSASKTARTATIAYLFTLTGSADGTTDVALPITSLQARMRTGDPTYLQVVIPYSAARAGQITARPNGTMEIDVAYLENGAYTLRETIVSVTLRDVRIDEGPMSKSISLTGRSQKTYANKTITLYRPVYQNVTNGVSRYRFAEPHVYLFPGDTVQVDDNTLTANTISYYVRARTGGVETQMEISEGGY